MLRRLRVGRGVGVSVEKVESWQGCWWECLRRLRVGRGVGGSVEKVESWQGCWCEC